MSARSLKTAAGLVAALAVAYAGASWYAGRTAQDRIETWVDQANQEIAAQWTSADPRPVLKIQDYQRGVFKSDIRYGLEFRDEDGKDQTLSLQDTLAHGPWPWAAVRQGQLQPVAALSRIEPLSGGLWQPWFDALPAGAVPWTLESRIGFDGGVASNWRLAPVKLADGQLDFGGGLVRLDYDAATRTATVSGRVDTLMVFSADSGVRVRFDGMDVEGTTTHSGESDLQSRQQARFAQVQVEMEDVPPVVLVGPSLRSDTARTGSLLDSKLNYDLGQLKVEHQDLGRITLALSVENLDVPGFQALAGELEKMGDEENAEDQKRLFERLKPVLAAGPRLALDGLRWETAQGATELKALAEFKAAAESADQNAGELLESAIRQLSVQANLSKAMVLEVVRQASQVKSTEADAAAPNPDMAVALISMMFDQYIGKFEAQGLVKRDGDAVTGDYRYADGQVTINGQAMSPAEAFGQFGGLPGLGD